MQTKTTLKPSTMVKRIKSPNGVTVGRTGIVLLNDNSGRQYRVHWMAEADGRAIRHGRGIRTWVKYDEVREVIDVPAKTR